MPTKTKGPREAGRHAVSNQLRDVIESRGLTAYGLGKEAGVDPGVIQRFLNRERDVRLETVDRIAGALGLRLVEVAKRGKGRPRKEAPGVETPVIAEDLDPAAATDRDDDQAVAEEEVNAPPAG